MKNRIACKALVFQRMATAGPANCAFGCPIRRIRKPVDRTCKLTDSWRPPMQVASDFTNRTYAGLRFSLEAQPAQASRSGTRAPRTPPMRQKSNVVFSTTAFVFARDFQPKFACHRLYQYLASRQIDRPKVSERRKKCSLSNWNNISRLRATFSDAYSGNPAGEWKSAVRRQSVEISF